MNKIILSCFAFVLAMPAVVHAEPIRLGVILDTSEELKVSYIDADFKKEVQGAAVAGLFLTPIVGGLIAGGTQAKRNASFAERLQVSVGENFDRDTVLQQQLTEEFAKYTSNIELVYLPGSLLNKKKPDFKQIDADVTPYVVVMKETAGMSTLHVKWGTLSPLSLVEMAVYDVGKKKRLLKEKLEGVADPLEDIDTALDTPAPFIDGYPDAASRLAYATYWRLNGKNILHTISRRSEHADEFASIEDVLAAGAKRFDIDRPKMKGWKTPKTGTPFMFRAEPKKDRKVFGIISDVDMLVKELGQEFETLDPYLAMRLTRQMDLGYGVDSAEDVPLLEFTGDWTSYMISDPRGGVGIFLHSQVDDLVVSHQIIVLEEDPMPILVKYQDDIQNYVDNFVMTVK